jgi:hypothetical protein
MKTELTEDQIDYILKYKKVGTCPVKCGGCRIHTLCDLVMIKYDLLNKKGFNRKEILSYIIYIFTIYYE